MSYSLEDIQNLELFLVKSILQRNNIEVDPSINNSLLNRLRLIRLFLNEGEIYGKDIQYINNIEFETLYLLNNDKIDQIINNDPSVKEYIKIKNTNILNIISRIDKIKYIIDSRLYQKHKLDEYFGTNNRLNEVFENLGLDQYPLNQVDPYLYILALYNNKAKLPVGIQQTIRYRYKTLSYEALEFYGDKIINEILMTPLMTLFDLNVDSGKLHNFYYLLISNTLFNYFMEFYGICSEHYNIPFNCLSARPVDEIKQISGCKGVWKVCADHLEALVGAIHYWNYTHMSEPDLQINIYDWLMNLEPVVRFYSMVIVLFKELGTMWASSSTSTWNIEYDQLRYSLRREILKGTISSMDSRFSEIQNTEQYQKRGTKGLGRDKQLQSFKRKPSYKIDVPIGTPPGQILDRFAHDTDYQIERLPIDYELSTYAFSPNRKRSVYIVMIRAIVRKVPYSKFYPDIEFHAGISIQSPDHDASWNEAESELLQKLVNYKVITFNETYLN